MANETGLQGAFSKPILLGVAVLLNKSMHRSEIIYRISRNVFPVLMLTFIWSEPPVENQVPDRGKMLVRCEIAAFYSEKTFLKYVGKICLPRQFGILTFTDARRWKRLSRRSENELFRELFSTFPLP